jgi:GTP cyclohydrolase FolE2
MTSVHSAVIPDVTASLDDRGIPIDRVGVTGLHSRFPYWTATTMCSVVEAVNSESIHKLDAFARVIWLRTSRREADS